MFTKKSMLVTLMLIALMLIALPALAAGPPEEVWVDDDFDGDTPGWGVTHFDSIQEGIDAVADGGTVNVAAGEYVDDITVDVEGLTLFSLEEHGAIIKGMATIVADDVTIKDIKFLGYDSDDPINSVVVNGVQNLEIKNCMFDGNDPEYGSRAVHGPSTANNNIIIDGCIFTGGYQLAVNAYFNNLTVKDSLIQDLNSGINLQQGNNLEVLDTDIYLNTQFADSNSYGVRFAHGGTNELYENMTISGGGIYDVGIEGVEPEPGKLHSAVIIRGAAFGDLIIRDVSINGEVVNDATSAILDARENWWGHETGPSGEGSGCGASVSENVLFDPWWADEDMTKLTSFPTMTASFDSGTWWFSAGQEHWSRFSKSTAVAMTHADMTGDGEMNFVGSYPSGTWYKDACEWVKITNSTATALAGYPDGWVAVSFASGTWIYDAWAKEWYKLTPSTAHALTWVWTPSGLSLTASFDSGTWFYKPIWSGIPDEDLRAQVQSDGFAEWFYWERLSTSTARALEGFEGHLFASFASGTWLYNAFANEGEGEWVERLTPSTAHAITTAVRPYEWPKNHVTGDLIETFVFSFPSGTWYMVPPEGASTGSGNGILDFAADNGGPWFEWERLSRSTARALSGTVPWWEWDF